MCSPNSQPCELQSSEDCGMWYWCADQAVKWPSTEGIRPPLRQAFPTKCTKNLLKALNMPKGQCRIRRLELKWLQLHPTLILYKTAQNTCRRDRKQEPDTFVSTIRLSSVLKNISLSNLLSLRYCSSTHPGQLLCSVQSWNLSSDLLQWLKMQAVHWVRGCRASQFFFH